MDVYPNPASTFFIVYNYREAAGRTIELMDMNGRMVKRQLVNSMATKIATTGLSDGLYILKVTGSNGKILRTQKIVLRK
ncbi:MAG: T9SS type A sorting domain-containing protein [Chitinophagaceae bacterium]